MTVGIQRTSVLEGNLHIRLINGTELLILKAELDAQTEEQINAAVDAWCATNDVEPCGIHRNRNGTYVVWTGAPSDVWPEDWSDEY